MLFRSDHTHDHAEVTESHCMPCSNRQRGEIVYNIIQSDYNCMHNEMCHQSICHLCNFTGLA